MAALIVLLLMGGIIVSLIISSWPSIQKFGFAFLWTKTWDAPNEQFGALVPIDWYQCTKLFVGRIPGFGPQKGETKLLDAGPRGDDQGDNNAAHQ